MLTVKVTIPGAAGAAAQRQEWFKIAKKATVEKFVNQCCSFEHVAVINRQPVKPLEDGCDMSILAVV